MAATSGQTRWRQQNKKEGESLSGRITRSARLLGRSTFGTDPGRLGFGGGAAGEDLRNAVSPHWKRVSQQQGTNIAGAATGLGVVADDVKAQRRALLVSDFRFVSRGLAERSRLLEGEFERFANSFGGDSAKEGFVGFTDFVEESGQSRKRQRDRRKSVRFFEEEEKEEVSRLRPQSWDVAFREELENGFQGVDTAQSWDNYPPLHEQRLFLQPTMMGTMSLGGPSNSYGSMSESVATTGAWQEGDNNSLYTNAIQEETDQNEVANEDISEQTLHAESLAFINDLAIPDSQTKQTAITRLKTVERHLSSTLFSQEPTLQDEQPLSPTGPRLLSASLDTALADTSNFTSFFYCPYLACHRRLVHQNARIPSKQQERSCVHTTCSYVSHDLEGWIRHCNTLHHEFAREGHEGCGFQCYSSEDTH